MDCDQHGCKREATTQCRSCGGAFCTGHTLCCAQCLYQVCRDCHSLFHAYGAPARVDFSACGTWPVAPGHMKGFLDKLARVPGMGVPLAVFLGRTGFVRSDGKVYFAITAQQRGDFHKFKWSISSNKNLVALLPLNRRYQPEWLAEQIGRAQALECLAPGQWAFVHSSAFTSSRDKERVESGDLVLGGFKSASFAGRHVKLPTATDQPATHELFDRWAAHESEREVIHNIDCLVPLYNSPLTMSTRARTLDSSPTFLRPAPRGLGQPKESAAKMLVRLLSDQIAGRDVLVLWGSRTGGGKAYLKEGVPAREFRHKTGKALFRTISAAVGTAKFRILAGDALSGIAAEADLTCMWDPKAMATRFGIDHGFSRLEQEYVFHHLARAAHTTLHIGMQSGNIETLIDNASSNVVCINENTRGGAGLVNVDRITGNRIQQVRKGAAPPCNLYLSYNLDVLPSAVGELSRVLMEKYDESISMRAGIERLLRELSGEKPEKPAPGHGSPRSARDLLRGMAKQLPPDRQGSSRPDLLSTRSDLLVQEILAYLADKVSDGGERRDKGADRAAPRLLDDLRLELKLLVELARSPSPRVQFAIRCLNNVLVKPLRSPREIRLAIIEQRILQNELHKAGKSRFGKGALPPDPSGRAALLVEQFGVIVAESDDDEAKAEHRALRLALDDLDDGRPLAPYLSTAATAELSYSPEEALQREWQVLQRIFELDAAEKAAMQVVCALLRLT
ncbi:MAG TPA: hypothetical protein VK698_12295 [Kofleriaceae bacterium]|nr:hypothetical protein [Kofleriaceae bacterium]